MALDRINATALLDGGVTSADLATQTGNVDFADNARIRLGDSQDLQLYHDAGNSRIVDAGTGNLNLQADNNVNILNNAGTEFKAQFITDGAVNLFYDNAKKFETTGTGVDVTGTVFSSDGQFGLDSTDYMQFVDNSHVRFITNGAEKMRLESGGHLMVGTTDTNPANNGAAGNPGIAISPDGVIRAARTGNVSLDINRMGSDGEIAAFRKDGNTVGRIGVADSGDRIYLSNSGAEGIGIDNGSNAFVPTNASGAYADNHISLGRSDARWAGIYTSDGLFVGGTGSANQLDDYEEGGWTPNIGGNATYTNAQGTYTKIGRYVCASFDITINVLGAGTTTTTLFGWPFTASLGALGVNSGHVSFYSGLVNNVYSLDMYIIANTTSAYFTGHTSASGNIANSIGVWQNGTRILGTVHYLAN